MANSFRKGHDVPRNFMRQYKSLGNIGPSGEEVFAEMVSLDAGSIGGGGSNTQYTEADVDATITGTAAMWEDTGDTLRAVSAAKPFPVNVVAGAAGGGIATQGARDGTAQSWFVSDNGGSLTVDSPQIPAALGQTTMVNSLAVVLASNQSTVPVSIAAAVPVTDNAGSLTVDSGQLPAALGQTTMANSLAVVLASNQSSIPVTGTFFQATQPVSIAAVVHVDDNAGSLTVDGTVAVSNFPATQPVSGTVTADTELPAAAALSDTTANPTTPMIGGAVMLWDGTQWVRSKGTAVDGQYVQGSVASLAADTGNPVKVGSKYNLVFPSPADGNRVDLQSDIKGNLRVAIVGHGSSSGVTQRLPGDTDAGQTGLVVAAENQLYDGTQWVRARGDVTNGADVDITRLPANGGAFDVDHDAVNTAKVEQVGGHASPVDVPPTAVSAAGDRVRSWYDRSGAQVVRRRKLRESYTAVCRLAEAAARLDQTFTQVANTNKQWATLHHTAGATKEVRLQKCLVYLTADTTVGIQGIFELRQISAAPATGNPAITPTPARRGGTAAEAVCLYLPTTAGTEANVNSPLGHVPFDTGISGAVSTVNPVPILAPIVLYDASAEDDEVMPPVLPVATLDGWAVVVRTVGAPVLRLTVIWKFTEEIP
jgi:hypothetical protein